MCRRCKHQDVIHACKVKSKKVIACTVETGELCSDSINTKTLNADETKTKTVCSESIKLNDSPVSICELLPLQSTEATCDATASGAVTTISHGNGLYSVELFLEIAAFSPGNTGCAIKINWDSKLPSFQRVFTVFKEVGEPTSGRVQVNGSPDFLVVQIDSELDPGFGYRLQETFLLCP